MVCSSAGPVIGSNFVHHQNVTVAAPVTELPDLPSEFPTTLNSPLAWTGAQFAKQHDYIHVLSESELHEVEKALEHFQGGSGVCRKDLLRR